MCSWNPFRRKTRLLLSHIVIIIAADDLAIELFSQRVTPGILGLQHQRVQYTWPPFANNDSNWWNHLSVPLLRISWIDCLWASTLTTFSFPRFSMSTSQMIHSSNSKTCINYSNLCFVSNSFLVCFGARIHEILWGALFISVRAISHANTPFTYSNRNCENINQS